MKHASHIYDTSLKEESLGVDTQTIIETSKNMLNSWATVWFSDFEEYLNPFTSNLSTFLDKHQPIPDTCPKRLKKWSV